MVHEAAEQDLYLFGATVEVLAPVQGDVVAAGDEARRGAEVRGDVKAVDGGRVRIGGRTVNDLRAGLTWLTGEPIEVDGIVEGELRASGRRVSLSGEVRGDAPIIAEELELLPGAICAIAVEGKRRSIRGRRSPAVSNASPSIARPPPARRKPGSGCSRCSA